MPEGLIYEGEYDNKPQFFRGETGAQSVIVPVLDAFLGISHENDLLRDYLDEMREYMPPKHRAFLEEIERLGPVRDFCAEMGGKTAKQFNDCVQNLQDFRTQHLEYAASYIHKQSQTKKNSTAVGTGGTPFMKYLKKHRDETEKHLIKLS